MQSTLRKRSFEYVDYVDYENIDINKDIDNKNKNIDNRNREPPKKRRKSTPPNKNPKNPSPPKTPPSKESDDDDDDPKDDLMTDDDWKILMNLLAGLTPDGPNDANKQDNKVTCNNPKCDHLTFEENPKPVDTSLIDNLREIQDINDLIKLGKTYHCKKHQEHSGLNLRLLCNLVIPLTELNDMIGLKNVKSQIVNQILFFLRGYNKNTKCNRCTDCAHNLPCAKNIDDMLHTVLTGPPGVGKTQLGKILAKVYKEMGVLSKGHFNLVTRSDLVGKYLGHTAAKTQEVINKCLGGVMFLDECYSLGANSDSSRDSFAKEAIDTLNQNLSEKRDFLCIIAGYKDQVEKCFFAQNEGLKRRFTFRYDLEGYSGSELMEIFLLKVELGGWKYEDDKTELKRFFESHLDSFPNYGGDIETLFLNCKISHCRKIINNINNSRVLDLQDMLDGFETFVTFRDTHGSDSPPPSIYID